jgi:cytochrome c oxidase subunit II
MLSFTGLLADQVAGDFDFFPADASTFAEANDWLFWFISWVCIVFFIPIAGALGWFMYKYAKPKGAKAESNVAHNTPLEIAWSVFPSFFLVAMFVLGAQHYLEQRKFPDGAFEVDVTAYKWGWGFDYGNGVIHPELHLLVNQPAVLSMRSKDVIHSLYVPSFRAKRDIVPGRENRMWFKPTKSSAKVDEATVIAARKVVKDAGKIWSLPEYDEYQFTSDGYKFFDLFCTEYCGTNHSQMLTVVVVHETQEDLDAWIKSKSVRPEGTPPEEYGKSLYQNRGCAGCHSNDGSAKVGPSFLNLFGTKSDMHVLEGGVGVDVTADYVRESILYPKAKIVKGYPGVMPSYQGQLSDDDINSVVAYLKSISDKVTPSGAEVPEEISPVPTTGAAGSAVNSAKPADQVVNPDAKGRETATLGADTATEAVKDK